MNRIATTPAITGTKGEHGNVTMQRPSPEAHDEYMRGRFELAQAKRDAYQRALGHFERAAQIDGQYAKAYTGIAESYIYMTDTLPLDYCYAKARNAVMVALRLDPDSSEAHRDLAYLQMNERNDLRGAEIEFQRALALNADDARTHHWYAAQLAAQRRSKESLQQAATGFELDPRSVGSMANYGNLLVQTGAFDQGLHMLNSVLKIDPNNEMTWGCLGAAYERMHRYNDAASAYDHAAGFESFSASYLADAAYARARAGNTKVADRLLTDFERRIKQRQWLPAQAMAMTTLALGKKPETREWLRRGIEDHTITLVELNSEPFYSEMKSDPQFPNLLAEAGLKP